jgi:hypothetical protein
MIKLTLVAASAAMALVTGATQADAQGYGYAPAPAYAYGGGGYAGYGDETGGCDQFTIAGAHVGATLFGFNAGVGGHFGFGDACQGGGYAQGYAPQAYAPPPQADYYPPAYPQAPWGAPYAYRAYAQPAYDPCNRCAPPPPPQPCGCQPGYGW